ncbi:putative Late nodulin [Medicago truncatula]|uniref:Late nodulin n=1 Tax=Medicago truncatula TaxID=3880 RepID=G8A260_MEDTR|nr:late nodulin [Medicago truncatula]RHN74816.1 putative Late nodulin [Medicago truncatula]
MQRRKNMDQIPYLFYAFIIFLYVFFFSTESGYIPCVDQDDCPEQARIQCGGNGVK